MSSHFALLPATTDTIVVSPAGASTAVTGLKRGVKYLVTATAAVNLEITSAAAVVKKGLYLAPNTPYYFAFGGADSQGTDPIVHVIGTADVYFTPVFSVATA